jgi:hypothetical protein
MKIFGAAFDRLKTLFTPSGASSAAPKTPTFAPKSNFLPSQTTASAAFQNVAARPRSAALAVR